jgi:hypothetical protein
VREKSKVREAIGQFEEHVQVHKDAIAYFEKQRPKQKVRWVRKW